MGNPWEFDCDVCSQGGDFDHLIVQLQREEEKKTILVTIIFCPGVGILIIFFRKCQNPHPMPDPHPLGLDIDRCINATAVSLEWLF